MPFSYTCGECGTLFLSSKLTSKYCSKECYDKNRIYNKTYERTPEIIDKYRAMRLGKKASEEARRNMSEAGKLAHKEGRSTSYFTKGHEVKEEWKEAAKKANVGSKRHVTPHSEATKKKISDSRKGKHTGESNNMWKGGITSFNYAERRRFKREIQKKVFERDNYTCKVCGWVGVNLQVDHIKSWSKHPDLRFIIENCETLCANCHYEKTYGREMPVELKKWGHNILKNKKINY